MTRHNDEAEFSCYFPQWTNLARSVREKFETFVSKVENILLNSVAMSSKDFASKTLFLSPFFSQSLSLPFPLPFPSPPFPSLLFFQSINVVAVSIQALSFRSLMFTLRKTPVPLREYPILSSLLFSSFLLLFVFFSSSLLPFLFLFISFDIFTRYLASFDLKKLYVYTEEEG